MAIYNQPGFSFKSAVSASSTTPDCPSFFFANVTLATFGWTLQLYGPRQKGTRKKKLGRPSSQFYGIQPLMITHQTCKSFYGRYQTKQDRIAFDHSADFKPSCGPKRCSGSSRSSIRSILRQHIYVHTYSPGVGTE